MLNPTATRTALNPATSSATSTDPDLALNPTTRTAGNSTTTIRTAGNSTTTIRTAGNSTTTIRTAGNSTTTIRTAGNSTTTIRTAGNSTTTTAVPDRRTANATLFPTAFLMPLVTFALLTFTLIALATPSHAHTKKRIVTRGQIAAYAALNQLGVSFSWGGGSTKGPTIGIGRGATTRGFDCSGLTLYAWSRAGIRLSHYTGAQFRQGRRVPLHARRTGDLLFFGGGKGDPTHVALFLREGIMIHAPKTGDVVKKTNFLGSPYYRTTFRGAVRPG
ncbi:NlpC/P60 family protein [Nonomuraea solani]|uniref:NlpC/P60 family protein n=1 Tax=Nonomuraea solani TaxID=1144553 RepID=A0A1H6EMU7_9ACTN|nr:NlpC/P60 family protein [Nonomuraea solani]SEG99152.1 NlpC/P60 family protein [Nonomuraea solani]